MPGVFTMCTLHRMHKQHQQRRDSECSEWKKAIEAAYLSHAKESTLRQLERMENKMHGTTYFRSVFSLDKDGKYDIHSNGKKIRVNGYDCSAEYNKMVDETVQKLRREMGTDRRVTQDEWGTIRIAHEPVTHSTTCTRTQTASNPANPAVWGFF